MSSPSGTITDNQEILLRIRAELEANGKLVLKTGVQAGEQSNKNPALSLAQIGFINEFGDENGGRPIPPRPFIGGTFDAKRKTLDAMMRTAVVGITGGRIGVQQALGVIGAWLQGQTQVYMNRLKEPKNAPFTVAQKGFDNPLINTRQLRDSIRWVVVQSSEVDRE